MKLKEIHKSLIATEHKQRVKHLNRSLSKYDLTDMSYEEIEELHWRMNNNEYNVSNN